MDTGLYRIELTGLARLVRLAGISGGFSGDPEKPEPEKARIFRAGFVWFPVALAIGFGAWVMLSGYSSKPAEGEPAINITLDGSMVNPPATPGEVTAAAEMAPVNGQPPGHPGEIPRRCENGARKWAQDFTATLEKGRFGVESPGHLHAPKRQ